MQGTVCVLLACLYYFYPPLRMGRGIFLGGFLPCRHTATRLAIRSSSLLNALPHSFGRALILGNGPLAAPLMAELQSHPELGIRVVGQLNALTSDDNSLNQDSTEEQAEVLRKLVKVHNPNRIIVAFGERRGSCRSKPCFN